MVRVNGYVMHGAIFDAMLADERGRSTLRAMAETAECNDIPADTECGRGVQQLLNAAAPLLDLAADLRAELARAVIKQASVFIFG